MSWLLVTLDFPPASLGGIASWASDLALALHAAGEQVTVMARAARGADDRALPYPVIRVPGRSWARWGGVWTALAGAGRVLSGGDELRVLFATWPLATLLGPMARRAGARVGIACHGSDLTRLAAPTAALKRALGSADVLLPVSEFLSSELARLGACTPVRVLPMPLPVDVPPAPRAPSLLCVARLTPNKGVDRAVRLAARLGLPIDVVGDGPEREDLVKRLDHHGLRWRGALSRAEIARIPAAAAVLLPRRSTDGLGAEGLGLVLLEAAARGLPAIGCHTGGVPEAVGPGLVLIDPDDPGQADLAAARALLADPSAGERARAWARIHHGPEACLRVLNEALPPSRSPAR